MAKPVIIVHSYEQACAALSAAVQQNSPLTLASAPDAGLQCGPAWFLSLIEQALTSVLGAGDLDVDSLLDCGDKPGCVLEAIRHGARRICFRGREAAGAKLSDIARQQNVEIVTERPRGLDLLGVEDPAAACRQWLASGSD